jgi:hypothetical protein
MQRRWALIPLLIVATGLPACGTDNPSADREPAQAPPAAQEPSGAESPGVDADDVEVIRLWAEALARGDVREASELFAIPSVATNGPVSVTIESRSDAVAFNETLPCGGELEATEREGRFVTATFRLKRRPGVPFCPGAGETAEASFVIEDGLISEWRRVGVGGAQDPGSTT